MALNLGELNQPVEIQQLTESIGTSGMPVESWTTLYPQAWMSKSSISGRERFAANQLSSPAVQQWTMRYVDDMDPDLLNVPKKRRLKYMGTVYDIVSADHIGRKEGIELTTLVSG